MAINPQDQTLLQKFTLVAKKVIYEPARMSKFLEMLGSKEGALTAVQTVLGAIDSLKPVPPQIRALLGVNAYMLMVDIAQEVTQHQPDPTIVKEVIGTIMQAVGSPKGPADQGMLSKMQEQPGDPEEAGDAPGMDNTAQHEGGEAPTYEKQEGTEEDGPEVDPKAGMLARMQQRRGVPA